MKFRPIQLDEISVFFIACLVFSQLLFANGIYLFACTAVFVSLFFLLQQRLKPGIFAFMMMQHILQIIAAVWQSNYLDKDINYRTPENSTAIYLSLIGVVFLFVPLIFAQIKLPYYSFNDIKKSANELSTDKVMRAYLISFFVASALASIAFVYPPFTQILFNLIKIKWLFFLLFGFVSFLKKEKQKIFYLCILVEIISGFFSFFSDFKTVIFYILVLIITMINKIDVKQLIISVALGAVLIFLALGWTAIKGEYRTFLNGGEKTQEVTVSRDEALNKIVSLSSSIDENRITASTKDALDRLQYTYHFAKTIERVPEIIPFQNGSNWKDNIEFAITPRYLNPDKPTLDNSIKTTKYTGIHYLSAKSGVSFSLGYFAEGYIDFGPEGMMFFLLALGIVYAIVYHYLMKKSSNNIIFNYAVVGSFFFEFYSYEMDGTFFIGRLFTSIITYLILVNFVFPVFIRYVKISTNKG